MTDDAEQAWNRYKPLVPHPETRHVRQVEQHIGFLRGFEAGRRAAPATVTRDELAAFLSAQNWSNASTRIDRQRFWLERADAIRALLPATVTPSREFIEDAARALTRYDAWRNSLDAGTTETEDMLAAALRAILAPLAAPPASTTTETTVAG